MILWAKNTAEFTVSTTRNVKSKINYSYISKPILDRLGTPQRMTFAL